MGEFLTEYGLFLAEAVTVVLAILAVIAGIVMLTAHRKPHGHEGEIEVTSLNDELDHMRHVMEQAILDKAEYKALLKEEKKKEKAEAKARKKQLAGRGKKEDEAEESAERDKRYFVLDFDGDIKASEVEPLREEINAVLSLAEADDEVVLRLESAGGLVHSYGLAASQLERIKRKGIALTICVDEVAASGGYMMACLADRLLAAPFAIVGSIGVIAQMPNFHRLLKKNDIDFEVLTAGEYKRTLTMFGQNTDKGRQKFVEELEDTHELFKSFVAEYRSQLEIDKVATGEVWFGKRALDLNLVDELMTSDEYLLDACDQGEVFLIRYEQKKSLQEKLTDIGVNSADRVALRWWDRAMNSRFWSR
ncbi:protease SohB [Marinobacterium arenosum]|uniref:protease SohB n=1 Tax=Marinobacterium arenosum TaxID=2862496 RepID=UPI001C94C268|nr:protease SohB [Marinobacterium arenosum]MBY4677261.1 protease SohB [Marinobacterium arenosum]